MKTKIVLLTLLVTALFVAGCARLGGATAEAGPCPAPAAETALHLNERLGYCLLYPDSYVVEARDGGDVVVIGSVMNHTDPRFDIVVEEAGGRTADEAADAEVAGLPLGLETKRSALSFGGEEAVVLDNVPGQEIGRLVFVVHGDRLYRLLFTHMSPDLGETYTRAENVYTVVANSFRFLP